MAKIDPLEIFLERCEARAILVKSGQMEMQDAVDRLHDAAVAYGLVTNLGVDVVAQIMAAAFSE